VTALLRLRLVVALGVVNLVLAVAAFGIAGTSTAPPDAAQAGPVAPPTLTPAPAPLPTSSEGPGRTPPPVALGSPPPSNPVTITPEPVTTDAPAAGTGPGQAVTPTPTAKPTRTAAPAPTPVRTASPTAPPPVAIGPVPPPGGGGGANPPPGGGPGPTPEPTPIADGGRTHPPCPGLVEGAPGQAKTAGELGRPCTGGDAAEHHDGNDPTGASGGPGAKVHGSSGPVPRPVEPMAPAEDRGRSKASPRRSRSRRMA